MPEFEMDEKYVSLGKKRARTLKSCGIILPAMNLFVVFVFSQLKEFQPLWLKVAIYFTFFISVAVWVYSFWIVRKKIPIFKISVYGFMMLFPLGLNIFLCAYAEEIESSQFENGHDPNYFLFVSFTACIIVILLFAVVVIIFTSPKLITLKVKRIRYLLIAVLTILFLKGILSGLDVVRDTAFNNPEKVASNFEGVKFAAIFMGLSASIPLIYYRCVKYIKMNKGGKVNEI